MANSCGWRWLSMLIAQLVLNGEVSGQDQPQGDLTVPVICKWSQCQCWGPAW